MRQRAVIGNWKMHGSIKSVRNLMAEIMDGLSPLAGELEIALCPSFVHMDLVGNLLRESGSRIKLGAQDAHMEDKGAYTGDVSAPMLADIGAHLVLVGHSERRSSAGETNDIVVSKFGAIQASGLIPVLCVGESLSQREVGVTEQTILSQIDPIVEKFGFAVFENALIAYEPVWAIGTGKTATPEQAQAVHELIRAHLAKEDAKTADSVRIIYGGSVSSNNAQDLFKQKDVDGGLVGGASLKAEEFISICKSVDR